MTVATRQDIYAVVTGLDRWLDTQRVAWPITGYGGPVTHWWNHCLDYRGAGIDWRYEGIIAGYLSLWRRSGKDLWLSKARRAADDAVAGQLPNGHFQGSGFERNPCVGGTPHEAAVDVGLLAMAQALRDVDRAAANRYADAARSNLEQFYLDRLWHIPTSTVRDGLDGITFVPNKAATFIEAMLLLAEIDGDPTLVECFAVPTGEHIIAMQQPAGRVALTGAIAQNRFGDEVISAYYPLYIARCVAPLWKLYQVTGFPCFRESALAAARFVARVQESDGGYPQVIYGTSRANRKPRWIAGAGDMLRAYLTLDRPDFQHNVEATLSWLLKGVRDDGRITCASGFGRILWPFTRRERQLDELGVVGWCDKAFRGLAVLLEIDCEEGQKARV